MAALRCWVLARSPLLRVSRTVAAGSHVREPSLHSVRYSHAPMQVGVARAACRCAMVGTIVWMGCVAMRVAVSHAAAPGLVASSEYRLL